MLVGIFSSLVQTQTFSFFPVIMLALPIQKWYLFFLESKQITLESRRKSLEMCLVKSVYATKVIAWKNPADGGGKITIPKQRVKRWADENPAITAVTVSHHWLYSCRHCMCLIAILTIVQLLGYPSVWQQLHTLLRFILFKWTTYRCRVLIRVTSSPPDHKSDGNSKSGKTVAENVSVAHLYT